jgi:uncharacterized protein
LLPYLLPPYATATARTSILHGPDHWQRVAEYGAKLCEATPGADPHVAALFAVLHDIQRLNDGYDPDHGRRAADLAARLRASGVFQATEEQMQMLLPALAEHADGFTTEDPTIGVCWDADRLDLPRVGIQPNRELLSTTAARRLLRN